MNNDTNIVTPFGNAWVDSLPNILQLVINGQLSRRQMVQNLESYYLSNGLYRNAETILRENGLWQDGFKPLRNPTFRAIEFHVAHSAMHTLGKEINVLTDNKAIVEPLKQVWLWSNWKLKQQFALRQMSLIGDLFLKVETTESGKVFFNIINAADVVDIRHDSRGNLTYIRIDLPFLKYDGQKYVQWILTEIWDITAPELAYMARWEYEDKGFLEFKDLTGLTESFPLSSFGIDFIPIVHGKPFDVGLHFGMPPIWTSLDKIDELNKAVTTLHQRLFRHNKPTWAFSSNQQGALGKAVPPPIFMRGGNRVSGGGSDSVNFDGEKFINLPPNVSLSQLIPSLDYNSLLLVTEALRKEIESDLPELKYGTLNTIGTSGLSGRAIRMLLADSVDRALIVRNCYEEMLIKAHKIALTLGDISGVFSGIGLYENGDFEHDFNEREIFPTTEYEDAETSEKWVAQGVPLKIALGWVKKTDAQIEAVEKAIEEENKKNQIAIANSMGMDINNDNIPESENAQETQKESI